jgi:hypothetical protein
VRIRFAGCIGSTFPSDGRPVGTRTPDLYRVNSEVQELNPFACLASPFIDSPKMAVKGLVLEANW